MWRLTNQRQVWYEWFAESFMPVLKIPPSTEASEDGYGVVNGHGSFLASASTPIATPSPLIDAIDTQSPYLERRNSNFIRDEFKKADLGVVKIGQTGLHNPGGKSSWIGL